LPRLIQSIYSNGLPSWLQTCRLNWAHQKGERMKRLLVAVATAAVFLAASAQAQYGGFGKLLPPRDANMGYKDGRDVLQLCTAQDETQLLECLGFLEGVSDLVVFEILNKVDGEEAFADAAFAIKN